MVHNDFHFKTFRLILWINLFYGNYDDVWCSWHHVLVVKCRLRVNKLVLDCSRLSYALELHFCAISSKIAQFNMPINSIWLLKTSKKFNSTVVHLFRSSLINLIIRKYISLFFTVKRTDPWTLFNTTIAWNHNTFFHVMFCLQRRTSY